MSTDTIPASSQTEDGLQTVVERLQSRFPGSEVDYRVTPFGVVTVLRTPVLTRDQLAAALKLPPDGCKQRCAICGELRDEPCLSQQGLEMLLDTI
ncbi:hypothetical protein [Chroococcidiopsis sp.]|uniref:hypothetical protein n=1 Tax=Chroococcidiopsis sp. TaxID=3088168 RepID=UPI003F3DA609